MSQEYSQQSPSSGEDQNAHGYMPFVPGWSAEEIQYLFTLRKAPGFEILFMSERQHPIPEMCKKLTERFGHHPKYNLYNLSILWDQHLAVKPPGRPTAPSGPQIHIEAPPSQSHSLAAPLSTFGGDLYEEAQTYHSQQRGQANPGPDVSHYGPPPNAYPPFAIGRASLGGQYGGRHMGQDVSYLFPPNTNLQSRAIAPHAPMSSHNYDDAGAFAMMSRMEHALPPHRADYGSPNIQPPFQNRGALAGRGNLGKHRQVPQRQGWGQSMCSGDLASGQGDQSRHGGPGDFGDFVALRYPDEMEDSLENTLRHRRFEDPDDSSDGLDLPSVLEMEDDFKRRFPDRACQVLVPGGSKSSWNI